MIYRAHKKQAQFHLSEKRYRALCAGKRSGKTECGAIESIIHTEKQLGFVDKGVDPYIGVIIAPTKDMLRRLSMKKFLAYSKPFKHYFHQTFCEVEWHNGSLVYGISADEPQRLEGIKANWVWIDEVFQVKEQLFLEAMARVSDQKGKIWTTGSLGVQYNNPKRHWVYKYFKEKPLVDSECFEFSTLDNPYFPKEEYYALKENLDERSFKQMFTIDWNAVGTSLVYADYNEENQTTGRFDFNPDRHEISVVIDWGWAHPMACLFICYDRIFKSVLVFDEIVESQLTIDRLYEKIMSRKLPITHWFCDISGTQEREQSGQSNVQHFRIKYGVNFKYRFSNISHGLSIVRSYIKSGVGERRLTINTRRCPKTHDAMLNYVYPEKDGQILNENPVKKDDDCCDALRYYCVNRLDPSYLKEDMLEFNRFGHWRF